MDELRAQTDELAELLKLVMEQDPAGHPSERAAAAFTTWLTVAGPVSIEPVRFADVAANYPVQSNSNQDLFALFGFLAGYLVFPDEPEPPRTFIGLPMAGA